MRLIVTLAALLFLSVQVKLPKSFKKQFTYVPSGKALLGSDTVSIQSFYMLNHEVTNKDYQSFLKWLDENGTMEEKEAAAIRVDNWKDEFSSSYTKLAESYHIHPDYSDYPVVNITHEGALLYCKWLENKINDQLKEGNVKVRLPYHVEFIRAGAGDSLESAYAWRDLFMRKTNGQFRANFVYIPQSEITMNENGDLVVKEIGFGSGTIGESDVTAPSKSYEAYSYGFHNLNGNVAEMISEPGIAVGGSWVDYGYDIRLDSKKPYNKSSTTVGFRPVFTVVRN